MQKRKIFEFLSLYDSLDRGLLDVIDYSGAYFQGFVVTGMFVTHTPPPTDHLENVKKAYAKFVPVLSNVNPSLAYRALHKISDFISVNDYPVFVLGGTYFSDLSTALDSWFSGHTTQAAVNVVQAARDVYEFKSIIEKIASSFVDASGAAFPNDGTIDISIDGVTSLDILSNWINVIRTIADAVRDATSSISEEGSSTVAFVSIDSGSPVVTLLLRVVGKFADRIAAVIVALLEEYVLNRTPLRRLKSVLDLRASMMKAGIDVTHLDPHLESKYLAIIQKLPSPVSDAKRVSINDRQIDVSVRNQIAHWESDQSDDREDVL